MAANAEPLVLRVQGFPQEMVGDPLRIEESWLPFFVGADYPLRIISATTRFDLRRLCEREIGQCAKTKAKGSGKRERRKKGHVDRDISSLMSNCRGRFEECFAAAHRRYGQTCQCFLRSRA